MTKYLLNYAEKNQRKFIVMYGQTEATARMTYLPFKMAKKKIGSIGVPIPGGKFYLQDNKKNIINKRNICGELVYK